MLWVKPVLNWAEGRLLAWRMWARNSCKAQNRAAVWSFLLRFVTHLSVCSPALKIRTLGFRNVKLNLTAFQNLRQKPKFVSNFVSLPTSLGIFAHSSHRHTAPEPGVCVLATGRWQKHSPSAVATTRWHEKMLVPFPLSSLTWVHWPGSIWGILEAPKPIVKGSRFQNPLQCSSCDEVL